MNNQIAVLPSNVLYVDNEFTKNSDIFNPKKDADIYLIGNSNILGVRQLTRIKDYLENAAFNVNNFALTYSDILNNYFVLRSHIPNGATVVFETNSELVLHDFALDEAHLKFDNVPNEVLYAIYQQIFKVAKQKKLKLILVNTLPERHRIHYDYNLLHEINWMKTYPEDYDTDEYHLSDKGALEYAKFIIKLINYKQYADVEWKLGDYTDVFYEEYRKRQDIGFKLLHLSEDYANFLKVLDSYSKPGKNGLVCAVMNPFTNGHKYLLQYAASKVDTLYLVGCNSDNFYFKAHDRYKMMELGVHELSFEGVNNIVLLPPSNAYANEIMFSNYVFNSIEDLRHISFVNMNKITCNIICKKLNIVKRFFGEEPRNPVANAYMDRFKLDAAKVGVEVEIIPRKKDGDFTISATDIRAMYEAREFDKMRKYLPENVLEYLKSIHNRDELEYLKSLHNRG